MIEGNVISIDIGSTYTKGALFLLNGKNSQVVRRVTVPTTIDALTTGFVRVLNTLLENDEHIPLQDITTDIPVFFSSSAKGGLKIAVIGLVPDLTVHIAKLAALSAGGKVVKCFSYHLREKGLQELLALEPDIILFTGGTDGGNEAYNIKNARLLSRSDIRASIIYAGNNSIIDEIADILSDKQLIVTENVMQDIGAVNVEPAREKIRQIFLERIVEGKGLTSIVEKFGSRPKPTPLALFELVRAIPEVQNSWDNLAVVDVGGATTDFYSNTESFYETPSVVLKGIREPRVKRTVEGDLGMRVSALSLFEAAERIIEDEIAFSGYSHSDMKAFVNMIQGNKDYLPENGKERKLDSVLAKACIYHSVLRHAGRIDDVYTPDGKVYVQRGKDLRKIRNVIATGGFFFKCHDRSILRDTFLRALSADGGCALLPKEPDYFIDEDYLFPLLGNIVSRYRDEAVSIALNHMKKH